jgi:hypothetical protein
MFVYLCVHSIIACMSPKAEQTCIDMSTQSFKVHHTRGSSVVTVAHAKLMTISLLYSCQLPIKI